MSDKTTTPCGSIRVAWTIDFFDPGHFGDAIDQIAGATGQARSQPHAVVSSSSSAGGRPQLDDAAWAERFAVVERIRHIRDSRQITLEHACDLEGIPYNSFRYWQQTMRERRNER